MYQVSRPRIVPSKKISINFNWSKLPKINIVVTRIEEITGTIVVTDLDLIPRTSNTIEGNKYERIKKQTNGNNNRYSGSSFGFVEIKKTGPRIASAVNIIVLFFSVIIVLKK
ncbi:MAG: hypothetical protein M3P98_01935 [bacterium]|nr:hypothetical protein [bacterium]